MTSGLRVCEQIHAEGRVSGLGASRAEAREVERMFHTGSVLGWSTTVSDAVPHLVRVEHWHGSDCLARHPRADGSAGPTGERPPGTAGLVGVRHGARHWQRPSAGTPVPGA